MVVSRSRNPLFSHDRRQSNCPWAESFGFRRKPSIRLKKNQRRELYSSSLLSSFLADTKSWKRLNVIIIFTTNGNIYSIYIVEWLFPGAGILFFLKNGTTTRTALSPFRRRGNPFRRRGNPCRTRQIESPYHRKPTWPTVRS